MSNVITRATASVKAVEDAGYAIVIDDMPAIRCASNPWDTYSAPTWSDLAFYAVNYQLCGCGEH